MMNFHPLTTQISLLKQTLLQIIYFKTFTYKLFSKSLKKRQGFHDLEQIEGSVFGSKRVKIHYIYHINPEVNLKKKICIFYSSRLGLYTNILK